MHYICKIRMVEIGTYLAILKLFITYWYKQIHIQPFSQNILSIDNVALFLSNNTAFSKTTRERKSSAKTLNRLNNLILQLY